MFSDIAV